MTINLSGMLLPNENTAFLNGDLSTENGKKIIKKLKDEGVIKFSNGIFQYNMGRYEQVEFDMDKLKEYDPIGVSDYLEEAIDDIQEEKNINKVKFEIKFHNYDDVVDLLKKECKLIVVCSDNLELMLKYDDLANFIIDYNNNVCNRKIECYDYFESMYQPCLITYGDDIDYCISEMEEDFSQRLEKAKLEKSKDYKVIDPETFNRAYSELDMGIDI